MGAKIGTGCSLSVKEGFMTLGSLDLLFSNLTVDMEASKEREGKSISLIKMCSLSGMSWCFEQLPRTKCV